MGGECNYLLRVAAGQNRRLELVPDAAWKSEPMMAWAEADISALSDAAERTLVDTAAHLRLPVQVHSRGCPSRSIACMAGGPWGISGHAWGMPPKHQMH